MATVKKLNTPYTIDTSEVIITGKLTVAGVFDTQTVTNTNIVDKDITLNAGESGAGVGGGSPSTSGIIVDRGSLANVALRWNESTDVWELTTDGSAYTTILSSASGGTALTAIVQDTGPRFGGNLITNGFNLQFQASQFYPPPFVPGNVILYSSTVGSAGSGLFVVNSGTASDELVTKSKAIVFSIIL